MPNPVTVSAEGAFTGDARRQINSNFNLFVSQPGPPILYCQANQEFAGPPLAGSADAIPPTYGLAMVTTAGVDAMTLAQPTAGTQDGLYLTVVSATPQAHTITTATNGINGTKHIATFGAAIGNNVILVAFQGGWFVVSSIGVTLS